MSSSSAAKTNLIQKNPGPASHHVYNACVSGVCVGSYVRCLLRSDGVEAADGEKFWEVCELQRLDLSFNQIAQLPAEVGRPGRISCHQRGS